MKVQHIRYYLSLVIISLLCGCGGSGSNSEGGTTQQTITEPSALITPQFSLNRSDDSINISQAILPAGSINATGAFSHPEDGEVFSGNFLVSVDVTDETGISAVAISFNKENNLKYLCNSSNECGGTKFHKTETNLNPADYGIYTGPIDLGLWVLDTNGNQMLLDSMQINWQRRKIDSLNAARSEDGTNISLDWQDYTELLRYNVYIAAQSKVNQSNFNELPQGRAFLALSSNSHTISGLEPLQRYYLLVTGVDGSGESAFSSEVRMEPSNGLINTIPNAINDFATDDEDTQITGNLIVNDVDAEQNVLTVSEVPVREPFFGEISLSQDGSFTYTPQANFFGEDSFIYEIQDGYGGFSQGVASLTINPVNDAPEAVDDNYSGAENQLLQISGLGVLSNDSDVDSNDLTVDIIPVIAPRNGDLTLIATGGFSYQPNSNFIGVDSFVYRVLDPEGASDQATVFINIGGANSPPIANNDFYNTPQNTTLTVDGTNLQGILANDNDPDGDEFSLVTALIDTVKNGTLTIEATGLFTYVPNNNFSGEDNFTYEIEDVHGASAQAVVTITVTDGNSPPIANDDNATVNEDNIVLIDVLANDTDADGDALEIIDWQVNNAQVNLSFGQLEYIPNENFNGVDTFIYTIYDGNAHTAQATVTINVNPVNDLPVAVDDSVNVNSGGQVNIDVLANDTDIDGDTLSVVNASTNVGSVIIESDNTLTFTAPVAGATATITYQISDGNGGSDTAMVVVSIMVVNLPPTATDDTYTIEQDNVLTVDGTNFELLTANDTDPEGDSLTVSTTPITDVTNGVLVLGNNGSFTYTPNASFTGTDTFEYQISDGNNNTDTGLVTITVTAANTAPIAYGDHYYVVPNNVLDVDGTNKPVPLANDIDNDGDTVQFDWVAYNVVLGVLNNINNDTSFNYTPTNGVSGSDSFVYQISDGNDGISQGVTTITVSDVIWNDTSLPNIPITDFTSITHDGTNFILASNHMILMSSNGINWKQSAKPFFDSTQTISSIVSGTAQLNPNVRTHIGVNAAGQMLVRQDDINVGRWAVRPLGIAQPLHQVIFDQGEFIAVGKNKFMTTSDGFNWLSRDPLADINFYGVARFGNRMVIVGEGGTIETNDSNSNWITRISNVATDLNDIATNGDILVAVGSSGVILTSTDGNTWTARTSPIAANFNAIHYGNSTFTVVGDNSALLTSVDGINWTLRGGIDAGNLYDVIFANGQFVIVGQNGGIVTSNDGVNFTQLFGSNYNNYTGLAMVTNGNEIVRVGNPSEIYVGDATNFGASVTAGQTFPINKVEYFNGGFIAVGDNGLVLTSQDGNTWISQATPTTEHIRDVFWFTGIDTSSNPFSLYVAVGENGLLMTSADGNNWLIEQTTTGTNPGNMYAVAHDDDYFVAVGDNGRILVRNNTAAPAGTTWMDFFTNASFGQLNDIVYDGSKNIIVGNLGVVVTGTAMGGNFTALPNPLSGNLNAIDYNNGNYIIVGDRGVNYTSRDGNNWVSGLSGTADDLVDVILTPTTLMATGSQGTVIQGCMPLCK